ncbi:AAA domain-containing protein [Actinoplanes missouriensis]|uniref:DEAD/DEAH box helicase n=1 Tax=Actinoplanes missouriensis TaxID=1866 RepID=UPI0033C020A2
MRSSTASRIVTLVRAALQAGPVPQGELLTALRNAGHAVELSTLWELCRTHGLADLSDGHWTPRGWAPMTVALAEAGTASVLEDWRAAANGAIQALREELGAVTSRRTETDVMLLDGHAIGSIADRKLMRFEAQSDIGTAEGAIGTLVLPEMQLRAEVISVFGTVVTLALPAETPTVREGRLRLDLSWLLNLQSERLHKLLPGAAGFDPAAALAVVSPNAPIPPLAGLPELSDDEVTDLGSAQRDAVRLALTPGVTWLWGPPGTGKTTTIGALVSALRERGRKVLLAAPTNAAVDVLVEALLKRQPELEVGDGSVVRLGQAARGNRGDWKGQRVLVDEIAASRGDGLAQRRKQLGEELNGLRRKVDLLRRQREPLTDLQIAERDRLDKEIAKREPQAADLDRQLLELRRSICEQAGVVAATAHQVMLPTLEGITFDTVVLDEASMTTAALAMVVAGAGSGHTIVAGDFRQLPPVAVSIAPAARQWLHQSAFEKAGIARDVQDGRHPARLAALTEQHRMRAPIGEVVSAAFYRENPLTTAAGVRTRPRRSSAWWAGGDLVMLDTSGLGARTARRQGTNSRYNLMHAQLVAGLLGGATVQTKDLAMITPFAAQARLLESLIEELGLPVWDASTVHRFQGGERDIVVYDTVDTGHGVSKLHPWFTDDNPESAGPRLLNVAASRAKDHLIVVGAFDQLHRTGTSQDPMWRFFANLKDRADALSWEQVVADAGEAVERVASEDVVSRLIEDIHAADNVEIWLPAGPLNALPELLPALISRPVTKQNPEPITIWVEPERDGHLPAQAMRIQQAGINIRACTPILESSAVIGEAVWSSSRSLLDPWSEVVLRTQSKPFADLVNRTQRRKKSDHAPGTGQRGEKCGRCRRPLVRREMPRRGVPAIGYDCLSCIPPTR